MELYYLCSKNKGADQLHGYSTADLHLGFCIGRFSRERKVLFQLFRPKYLFLLIQNIIFDIIIVKSLLFYI